MEGKLQKGGNIFMGEADLLKHQVKTLFGEWRGLGWMKWLKSGAGKGFI